MNISVPDVWGTANGGGRKPRLPRDLKRWDRIREENLIIASSRAAVAGHDSSSMRVGSVLG